MNLGLSAPRYSQGIWQNVPVSLANGLIYYLYSKVEFLCLYNFRATVPVPCLCLFVPRKTMARAQSADITLHLVHGILGLRYPWYLSAWQLATGPGVGIGSGEIAVIAPEPASPHRNLKI